MSIVVSGANVSRVVSGGESICDVEVLAKASLCVADGGYVSGASVRNAFLYVSGGGVARTLVLSSAGTAYISSGGILDGANITAVKTLLHVSSGGTATGLNVSLNGNVNVVVLADDAETFISGSNASGTFCLSGGTASGFILYSRGAQTIGSGALTSDITVGRSATLSVSSGGSALGVVQETGGFILAAVYGGDTATLVSGTNANGDFYLSGGTAENFLITNGCFQTVYSGGVAIGTVASGVQARIGVYSGGLISSATVGFNASLTLNENSEARDVEVLSGGNMFANDGVRVSGVSVRGEAVFSSTRSDEDDPIAGNGDFPSDDPAVTVISSAGSVSVAGMYIGDTGCVTVFNSAVLTDTVTVEGALVLEDGAAIVLDVSGRADADAALVSDWSRVAGADYGVAIRFDDAPVCGAYKLAGGAATFDRTVTVAAAGAELGTLVVGGELVSADYTYTLGLAADTLTLTVAGGAPAVEKPTRGDFNGNGISDILFQNLTDPMNPLGAWMDADMWQWNGALGPAAKSDWTVYGAFDFTGDQVCDIMFRSKLAETEYAVGFYDMGEGGTFKTMGWGVTAEWDLAQVGDFNGNGVADILWSNTETGYHGLWLDGTDSWVALPYSYLTPGVQTVFGVGDVNGDGRDDILINSAGNLGAWDISGLLDGTEAAPVWIGFGLSLTSDWETVGAADFDGNGSADIVLWNKDSGYVGAYMNCDPNQWTGIFPNASHDEWGIPGFGDYNGDGCDDVLVRNLATGALGYWSGKDNFAWNGIGWGVDSTWAVIA